MDLNENNVSTILVWVYVVVAPYLSAYMSQEQFITIATAVIGLMLAIWSAYNPNQMEILGNEQ